MGIKGDFIGFHLGDYYSADLNIVRVSNGTRYSDSLIPELQDKTVEIPGGDGSYFFGSNYTKKTITLQFAFDSVTEANFRDIKKMCGVQHPVELWFDEAPYKKYYVKLSQQAVFDFICFFQENKRIYKGEATLELVAYQPYAVGRYRYLDESTDTNKEEWAAASNLKNSTSGYNTFTQGYTTKLYNSGDVVSPFKLKIPVVSGKVGTDSSFVIYIKQNSKTIGQLEIQQIQTTDAYIIINTKTQLIEGYTSTNVKTKVYNQYRVNGEFFKIPVGASDLYCAGFEYENAEITYDYLYY